MLNANEITELFKRLERKHGVYDPEFDKKIEDGILTGDILGPEQLRNFSDEFDIPVDIIRTFSLEQFGLLMAESCDGVQLSFEAEQEILDQLVEVEKAGGLAAYLKQKTKKKQCPSQQLLPSTRRR
ncbi:MAG: hypothetical protein WCS89_00635 [Candidatus Paceibacterota bacterium]|jgi:hypothetical protein